MKLACMTLPYATCSMERALEGISRAGYRYIGIGNPHGGIELPEADDSRAIGQLDGLFAMYNLQPLQLMSNAHFKIDQPIERARQRMQLAKALGIKEILTIGTQSYRSFPSAPLTEEEMQPINRAYIERYKQIAEEAAALDLIITIKPHTGNTATAADMLETLQQIDSPHIRGCYDPGNVEFYEGIVASDDFPQVAKRTYSLIAKDHRGERGARDFPIPGTGDVDFPAIFTVLKRGGFEGNVFLERVDGPAVPELIDQRIADARMHLVRMLKEAGFKPE
ncbi:sugar phosphate isomerase/epimerase [Paenibacillus mesophilus]|uniref:sugar phosphate isomerase/epimerase family protein n=1 Tax=Paenibacillus mesophilus TaxID=2582849 RepID=UPI00110F1003|nr:TIM barrel protein [Paenibacillus mesophilus]TMV44379.1 sugar phosphate isomerase/epimerase [Paenibacillus mesophilus]